MEPINEIETLELIIDGLTARLDALEKEVKRLKAMHALNGSSVHPTACGATRRRL